MLSPSKGLSLKKSVAQQNPKFKDEKDTLSFPLDQNK